MNIAAERAEHSDDPLETIAHEVGHGSGFATHEGRAGISPGSWASIVGGGRVADAVAGVISHRRQRPPPRSTIDEREADLSGPRNVVLVHGAFADGSGWKGVYEQLSADGYNVSVVQNQTLSLEGDVKTTNNVLDRQDGPTILVGHSYGGAVITEAGTHDSVVGLVFIAAYAPGREESVGTLIAAAPSDVPPPPILPPQDGFLFLDRDKFAEAFAADVPARDAAFMADSQVPLGADAVGGTISDPAWRSKPSWYLITTEDNMIPPQQQQAMAERVGATTTDVPGNHAIYVSQPSAVADLTTQAARSLTSATSVA
jgi:pimeloyl-ACP methyl ester carboxylesterase